MPSTTRGSILISTANDIGEALVEKLGGVGYSPNEWKEKYNLCGIAPVDSAPALSVLADSAGTGDERGSILIATADAIGAILNKKYNVLRGFKPKEWASACRKMKALEEGSVASASIASFSDGADTVPLTSCVCNIDANLGGKSAVNAGHAGVNLFNKNAITPNTWIVVNSTETEAAIGYLTSDYIPVKANTKYYVSTKSSNRSAYYDRNKNGIAYFSFSGGASFTALYDGYIRLTINNNIDLDTFIVNEGDTQATYEAYKGETKTADLGRTIYGGQADIITGEGQETEKGKWLSELSWTQNATYPHVFNGAGFTDRKKSINWNNATCLSDRYTGYTSSEVGTKSEGIALGTGATNTTIYVSDDRFETVAEFTASLETDDSFVVLPLETPTDFTFEPVKIDSFPGVNNIWNDCGNTAVEYYQAPTPYTRKTATGGIANFSDQRTDLPLTKAIANIAPSIAGKSAVNLIRTGNNLFDKTKATIGKYINVNGQEATNEAKAHSELLPLKPSTSYYMSGHADASYYSILALDKDMNVLSTWYGGASKTEAFVATTPSNARWCYLNFNADQIDTMIFVESATAISYEPYNGTTYAAELGETVYGGSVDFVSGELNNEYGYIVFDGSEDENWSDYSSCEGYSINIPTMMSGTRQDGACNLLTRSTTSAQGQTNVFWLGVNTKRFYAIGVYNSMGNTLESFRNFLSNNNMILVYPLATPTESTIPGRVISPIDGVNNYWNDAGGDTEIQYFEDET